MRISGASLGASLGFRAQSVKRLRLRIWGFSVSVRKEGAEYTLAQKKVNLWNYIGFIL